MGERIHWDDSEWERIVQLATPILLADKKVSVIKAVQMIQDKAIDAGRRRSLPNIGSIRPDIRMRLEGCRKVASGQVEHVAIDLYKEIQERLEAAHAQIKTLTEENHKVREANTILVANKPKPPMEIIKDFMSDIVADAMRKNQRAAEGPVTTIKIDSGMLQARAEQLTEELAREDRHKKHVSEMEPSGIRKPRLVIIGGTPPKHQELHREFGNDLRLQFFHGTSEQGRLGDQLRAYRDKSHGKVIVWGNYCGHSAENALKFQNIPYETFKGEIQSFKERIRKYINGGGPSRP